MLEEQLRVGETTYAATSSRDAVELSLLVLDIVKSTELLRSLGDRRYAYVIESFKDSVYEVMDLCGGMQIADTGDGFIYAFDSAQAAVAAAVAVFEENRSRDAQREASVCLRCGVHSGQLVVSRYGIVGLTLYEAVELGNAAGGDEIWMSISAAKRTTLASVRRQFVELPRSGFTEVVVLDRPAALVSN